MGSKCREKVLGNTSHVFFLTWSIWKKKKVETFGKLKTQLTSCLPSEKSDFSSSKHIVGLHTNRAIQCIGCSGRKPTVKSNIWAPYRKPLKLLLCCCQLYCQGNKSCIDFCAVTGLLTAAWLALFLSLFCLADSWPQYWFSQNKTEVNTPTYMNLLLYTISISPFSHTHILYLYWERKKKDNLIQAKLNCFVVLCCPLVPQIHRFLGEESFVLFVRTWIYSI